MEMQTIYIEIGVCFLIENFTIITDTTTPVKWLLGETFWDKV